MRYRWNPWVGSRKDGFWWEPEVAVHAGVDRLDYGTRWRPWTRSQDLGNVMQRRITD